MALPCLADSLPAITTWKGPHVRHWICKIKIKNITTWYPQSLCPLLSSLMPCARFELQGSTIQVYRADLGAAPVVPVCFVLSPVCVPLAAHPLTRLPTTLFSCFISTWNPGNVATAQLLQQWPLTLFRAFSHCHIPGFLFCPGWCCRKCWRYHRSCDLHIWTTSVLGVILL